MEKSFGKCELCNNGNLILKETKAVGGSEYKILKCDKCNYEVARGSS
ncbi:hypothetical protein J4209_04810 [Candidatus Woesearchaeota archaeon]|nr:hypothetical protein [Candidatus Woesearchaeota archaeon]